MANSMASALSTRAAAVLCVGALLMGLVAPAASAPLPTSVAALKGASAGGIIDVRYRGRGGAGIAAGIAVVCWRAWPNYPERVRQHRHMVLRRRYWLYYLLIFMSGARRQIFVVFAGFLMVEKFGYSVGEITLLFLLNSVINIFLAPRIGTWIGRIGDRKALILEYAGLIVVFTLYAFVTHPWLAAGLYVVDHLFFALAIAIKTYFQKISDPRDIAPTAAVSFTISHIAAVVLPAALGLLWLVSPAAVFLTGTGFAVCSLVLSQLIPPRPEPGRETLLARPAALPAE